MGSAWIDHPNQESLRRAFLIWATRIGLRRHLPDLNPGELHDAQEISTMLATRTTDWTLEWRQQGENRLLRRQLQHRFGPNLPDWVDERLQHADIDQIETWGEAVLDAPTLEAVFGEIAVLAQCPEPLNLKRAVGDAKFRSP